MNYSLLFKTMLMTIILPIMSIKFLLCFFCCCCPVQHTRSDKVSFLFCFLKPAITFFLLSFVYLLRLSSCLLLTVPLFFVSSSLYIYYFIVERYTCGQRMKTKQAVQSSSRKFNIYCLGKIVSLDLRFIM